MKPIIVNSFPKSGTHLVTKYLHALATPCQRFIRFIEKPPFYEVRRLTTHENGGWGPGYRSCAATISDLSMIHDGEYAGAHLAAFPEVVDWIKNQGWAVIFLYRDLRDVAVSQAYHIEGGGKDLYHPGRDEYMALPDHKARIKAVFEGLNGWPGLMDRWRQWNGWLDVPWCLPVSFRKARHEQYDTARLILMYLEWRLGIACEPEMIDAMLEHVNRGTSRTFRKGEVGGWVNEFDDELMAIADREVGNTCRRLFDEQPV